MRVAMARFNLDPLAEPGGKELHQGTGDAL